MAGNILWSGFAAPVFLIFAMMIFRRIRDGHFGSIERLMLGVMLVAGASAIHRIYWALWRYFLDRGETEIAAWFVSNTTWLTMLVVLVAIGYALHLKPYLQSWIGALWLPVVILYAAVIGAIPFIYN